MANTHKNNRAAIDVECEYRRELKRARRRLNRNRNLKGQHLS